MVRPCKSALGEARVGGGAGHIEEKRGGVVPKNTRNTKTRPRRRAGARSAAETSPSVPHRGWKQHRARANKSTRSSKCHIKRRWCLSSHERKHFRTMYQQMARSGTQRPRSMACGVLLSQPVLQMSGNAQKVAPGTSQWANQKSLAVASLSEACPAR